ncbi:MAG TPA: phage holin family protein [Caulobacteraceae bacterium]
MARFLLHALAAALGFWLAAKVIPGVHVSGLGSLLAAGLLLGVVNALVRPILVFLTFPLTVVTLGLFLLVVNGMMVSLVAFFIHGVRVHAFFWDAILASLVISLTSWAASAVINRSDRQRRR